MKFYVVADYDVRAKRRLLDFKRLGEEKSIDNLIEEIKNRDKYDSERKDSPLLKANDAIEVDTTNMTIEQQVDIMYKKIKSHSTTLNIYKEQLVREEVLTEEEPKSKISDLTYKIIFLLFIVIGAAGDMSSVWGFSDAMILALIFPNMIGLFFLYPKVKEELVKYLNAIKKK